METLRPEGYRLSDSNLADLIRKHWANMGYFVRISVEPGGHGEPGGVRSNMLNGLPRDALPANLKEKFL
jgi:hypothetical protein